MKIVYSIHDGSEAVAQRNPARSSTYLMPAGTTHEKPPVFNPETHTCKFHSGRWWLKRIIKEEHKPEIIPAMEQLRVQRDGKLANSDWRMTEDYTKPDKAEWKAYRAELRSIPNRVEAGEFDVSLDSKNQLIFKNWPKEPTGG